MHDLFTKEGFILFKENFGRWSKLPIKRKYINSDFERFSDSELMNVTSSFLATKSPN